MDIFKKLYSKFVGLVVILLILMAANSFVGLFNRPKNVETQEIEETVEVENSDSTTEATPINLIVPITYESESNDQNAFELLKDVAKVEYKEYDFGVFVESINGTKGDDKHFWAFYVNDEKAQAGAGETILQKGDKVEWKYEEIK